MATVSATMDPREGSVKQRQLCPVRSPDGERCCRPIPHAARKHCRKHHKEYRALYRAYKDASVVVKNLELCQISQQDIRSLWCAADVEDAMDRTEQFLNAIRTEIEGRELHEARFIENVDDGHAAYLERLKRKEKMSAVLLARLKARLHEINTGTISYITKTEASEERANMRRPFRTIQASFSYSEQQRRRQSEYIRWREGDDEASRRAMEEWRALVHEELIRAEAARRQKQRMVDQRGEPEVTHHLASNLLSLLLFPIILAAVFRWVF